jgi:hypothetical protein
MLDTEYLFKPVSLVSLVLLVKTDPPPAKAGGFLRANRTDVE